MKLLRSRRTSRTQISSIRVITVLPGNIEVNGTRGLARSRPGRSPAVSSRSDRLAGRNVILLNCFDEDHDFPAVLPDDRAGGAAAVGLAAAAGHRRIALLGGA